MSKRFLVLGCNGMAGHVVSLYLKEKGHKVLGLAQEESKLVDSVVCDVRDTKKLDGIIKKGNFDYIINCVGILNSQAEINKDNAVFINSFLPHHLAQITKNSKTKVVHLSTDCIFSGLQGDYTENSFPDATTFYGRTKALGELNDDKNITIRTSIIGPDINEKGIGLFNWFMKQKGEVNGYAGVIWTGITTIELAKVVEEITSQNVSGLFNIVNDEKISKYALLSLIGEKFNKNISIKFSQEPKNDKSLKRTNFSFDYRVPSYEKMIDDMKLWVEKHPTLYPKYRERKRCKN